MSKSILAISLFAWDGGKSGIAEYMRRTTLGLLESYNIEAYILESDLDSFDIHHKDLRLVVIDKKWTPLFKQLIWHTFILPFYVQKSKAIALFLPAGNRRLCLWGQKWSLPVVHDLSQYHIPTKYDRVRMFYIKTVLPFFARLYPKIMSVSHSTAKDLTQYWHIPSHKICTQHSGYPQDVYHPNIQVDLLHLNKRYGIQKPYILYVSRIEHPGKNHVKLIEAYALLPEQVRNTYDLICAGAPWPGWEAVESKRLEQSCADQIRMTGHVDFKDLAQLYKQATLYICPSLFEGFGFPVLEAMACGTPTTCSNQSSLPEIVGSNALMFDPYNAQDMANVMNQFLSDPELRNRISAQGILKAQEFSWTIHVNKLKEQLDACQR